MASTRDLRRRIRSVKNTEQMTRAMKIVAAARLRRAQERILSARPYAHRMRHVLRRLAARTDTSRHPLLRERTGERVELLVVTSDRGWCGAFNASIIRQARTFLEDHGGERVGLHIVGRKGRDFFRRHGYPIQKTYSDVFRDFSFDRAREIGQDLIIRFEKAELDAVHIIYNEFKSAIQQDVVVQKLLPLERFQPAEPGPEMEYLYEPDPARLLDVLLPRHVNVQIWAALLESNAAENGARMAAMDAATKNAGELIERLVLQMNRIRQAAITKEIIEVVSGADALG
ncbi:MAG: ATP synthase F1 subunit gamma [Acidobacteriota bacterium]